jgi:hypothetical protein
MFFLSLFGPPFFLFLSFSSPEKQWFPVVGVKLTENI